MLSLPPIALDDDEGEYELVLPFPSVEWVRLLGWNSGDRSSAGLVQQLAENPALMIYGAISFRTEQTKASESLAELGEWFADHVSNMLQRHDITARSVSNSKECAKCRYEFNGESTFQKPLKKYLQSSRGKRSGLLCQFLVMLVNLPKQRAKKLVAQYVKGLLDQSEPRPEIVDRSQSQDSCSEILRRWRDGAIEDAAVAALLTFHRKVVQQQSEFQQRLQQEKLASLHQLAYGASHEINNPLANIATRAQSLLVGESNPDRRHKLGTIYEQAMRSHEMISDLMLFGNPPALHCSRIDLKNFLSRLIQQTKAKFDVVTPAPASGETLATEVAAVKRNGYATQDCWMESQIPSKSKSSSIQLMVRIAPGIDFLECDSSQLNVALLALIQNGIESLRCSSGQMLELRVSSSNGRVVFEVVDDGRGVSDSIARHMFDPFFSGREAGRGLGFGLSKAWRIAQLHNGNLSFDPHHKPGARFVLDVPQVAL